MVIRKTTFKKLEYTIDMIYDDFQKIPQFPQTYYGIDVGLDYLEDCLANWDRPDTPLIMNPEWQRGHVWTQEQQIRFMEFMLMGGTTGMDIYFNCSSWQGAYDTPVFVVDGLQRLTAAMAFVRNEIPAFGTYRKDYKGKLRSLSHNRFRFNMLCLKSKRELLNLYIMFNSGGVIHKPEEIERIKKMLEETSESEMI